MWLRRRVLLQLNGNIQPEDLEESRLNMANIIDKAIMRERGKSKETKKKEERGGKRTKRAHGKQE